jgi:aspartyl-tRNA(Asn)/glutamyl-tRNA(Gln) amidotransferase subunit A
MTLPGNLPSAIGDLRDLIIHGDLSVEEAIRLQHEAIEATDAFRCVVHRFPLPDHFPDRRAPLAGVGLAHKDIFHMYGRAPGCGTGIPSTRSGRRSAAVAHLDNSGAHVLAAVTMAESAGSITAENALESEPINPLDTQAVVGGSSSGSAVAVASGLCYGSLGTDTAGSVRIPAATCGVVGFKPSRGALSPSGVAPLARSLDTVGILCRSPIDVALLFEGALSPRRKALFFGNEPAREAVAQRAASATRKLCRICLTHADPAVQLRDDIANALHTFAQTLGTPVEEARIPCLTELMRRSEIILDTEASAVHLGTLGPSTLRPGRFIRHMALTGAVIPTSWYEGALRDRSKATASFIESVFGAADFLLTPVLPQGIPNWDAVRTTSARFNLRALLDMLSWASFVNYLNLPAIVLPIGRDARERPVSVQIVAKPHGEVNLLGFAHHAFSVSTGIS